MIPYIPLDTVVLISIAVVTVIYYFSTSTYDQLRRLNVPHMSPVPLFGNLFKVMMCMENQMIAFGKIYRRFSDTKICGFYQMRTPYLMIRDPGLVDAILIKDFSYFTDHGMDFDQSINFLARSLFFAKGLRWRIMRQKLSPGFTSGKLKCMNEQIKNCSEQLMQCIDEKSMNESGGFEVKDIVGNFTTDVIGTCAFGLKLDTITDSNSIFRKYIKQIFSNNYKQLAVMLLAMVFPKVVKFFKFQTFPVNASNFFHSVFADVIDYRTKNNVVRNDLVQTLLEARKQLVLDGDSTSDEKFIDLDIIANATLMFTAGAETVSVTLSYCLYELALNSDIQNKLRDEINLTNEKYGGQFTNEFLMDLHYADMVLDETHRKYSITVNLLREATQTYRVPGMESFTIEKGQKIVIPMSSIHHDPKYYPDPNVFDPERFTKEEKSKRPNCTFIPFGEGPRHCIGKRFAEYELKLALSKILTKFEILTCPKTEIPLIMLNTPGIIQPKNGIWLHFRPIVTL